MNIPKSLDSPDHKSSVKSPSNSVSEPSEPSVEGAGEGSKPSPSGGEGDAVIVENSKDNSDKLNSPSNVVQGKGLGDEDVEWLHNNLTSANVDEQNNTLQDYQRAAKANDAYGQYLLGYCYQLESGWGDVKYDYEEAVKLFTASAEQGNSLSQYMLGLRYEEGRGKVNVNKSLAIVWSVPTYIITLSLKNIHIHINMFRACTGTRITLIFHSHKIC